MASRIWPTHSGWLDFQLNIGDESQGKLNVVESVIYRNHLTTSVTRKVICTIIWDLKSLKCVLIVE